MSRSNAKAVLRTPVTVTLHLIVNSQMAMIMAPFVKRRRLMLNTMPCLQHVARTAGILA